MKKKILIILITYFIANLGFAQNYEIFESDKIENNRETSLVFQEFNTKYDLIISKHNVSRNDKNEIFEVVAIKDNIVEKFIIKLQKKSKRFSIKKLRVSNKTKNNFQNFIDNLVESDFFRLENENINCWVENKDKSISIAPFDNNLYYFEIIVKGKYKLLYSDCIENHPNAVKIPNEKDRLKYWECLNIFNDYWK